MKPFLPIHMGPRLNVLSKINGQKSCDTLPANTLIVSGNVEIVESHCGPLSQLWAPTAATQEDGS